MTIFFLAWGVLIYLVGIVYAYKIIRQFIVRRAAKSWKEVVLRIIMSMLLNWILIIIVLIFLSIRFVKDLLSHGPPDWL